MATGSTHKECNRLLDLHPFLLSSIWTSGARVRRRIPPGHASGRWWVVVFVLEAFVFARAV